MESAFYFFYPNSLDELIIVLTNVENILKRTESEIPKESRGSKNTHLLHSKIVIGKVKTSIKRLKEFQKHEIFSKKSYESIFDVSEAHQLQGQLLASGMIGEPLKSKVEFITKLIDKFLNSKNFQDFKNLLDFLSDFFGSLTSLIPYLDSVKEWLDLLSKFDFNNNPSKGLVTCLGKSNQQLKALTDS